MHELASAYYKFEANRAGREEWLIFKQYDFDPLDRDAEALMLEQCEEDGWSADFPRRARADRLAA